MSSWRQQSLIEAPLDAVWALVGDPRRYPEWASHVLEVTGLPALAEGATFEQLSRVPGGRDRTTFVIEELDDLREIRLRCRASGLYSQWWLAEARSDTFADVEIGMDPTALRYHAFDRTIGKRWYRQMATQMLDSVRERAATPT